MKKFTAIFLTLMLALVPVTTNATTTLNLYPNSTPLNSAMTRYEAYRNCPSTRQYYAFRSNLEKLESTGGGTLNVKRGTYTISNTLYVPSNVTINFEDGVVINKGNTSCRAMQPATSMFQLIRPSRANNSGVYGGYSGEHDIKFLGHGKVVFDQKYLKDRISIITGHNNNVLIDNIHFQNMNSGHFIEMDASQNVTVSNSEFMNSYASEGNVKEAINLDTPDKATGGFSQKWSKFDKTGNKNVFIHHNEFYNLDRAIGTHKYSQDSHYNNKYHYNVQIYNNKIDKMRNDAIRVMNWSAPVIRDNQISNVAFNASSAKRGILLSGAQAPTIKNNTFTNVQRAFQIMAWKNTGGGSTYHTIYNSVSNSSSNLANFKSNKIKFYTSDHAREGYARYYTIYNVYDRGCTKFPVTVIN